MEGREEEIDERFKQVLTDPRFKTLRKRERKVKIDSRFQGMFDKKFNGRVTIDKRGKRLDRTSDKSLKNFYEVSSDEDEEAEGEEEGESGEEEKIGKSSKKAFQDSTDEGSSEDEGTKSPIPSTSKEFGEPNKRHRTDLRGENNELLSSSSDEESSEEEEDEEIDHNWGELDKDAPRSDNITRRLAVCNLDWDRVKAQDIYALFNSFKSECGEIRSVRIYPSQFGKERMEEEKISGPKELTSVTLDEDEEGPYDDRNAKDDEDIINTDCPLVSEKLRQYQINRLKYFYAVVECDSKETAAGLYDQLNGMEYESSASTLDVRVVPDGLSFDDDEPTSECFSMPPLDYKPPLFITTALQQSKVKLTWDETDPERSKTFQRAFTDHDKGADDLAVYLASSSGEESDSSYGNIEPEISQSMNDEERIEKYKNLIKSLEEEEEGKDDDVDMEVTWQPELESIEKESDEEKKEEMSLFEREKSEKKDKKSKKPSEILIKDRKQKRKRVAIGSDVSDQSEEESAQEENFPNDSDEQSAEESVNNLSNQDEDLSDDEEKERNKEALSLLTMGELSDKKHFNYDDFIQNNQSKRRRKKKKADNEKGKEDKFQFNADDPRFSAIYSSHLFNIDQSSSHFKKTPAIDEVLQRKARKPEPAQAKKPKTEKTEGDALKSFVETAKLKTSVNRKWRKN